MSEEWACPKCKKAFHQDNPPKKLINCSHNLCFPCLKEELGTNVSMQFAPLTVLASKKENTLSKPSTLIKISLTPFPYPKMPLIPILTLKATTVILTMAVNHNLKATVLTIRSLNSRPPSFLNFHRKDFVSQKETQWKWRYPVCLLRGRIKATSWLSLPSG